MKKLLLYSLFFVTIISQSFSQTNANDWAWIKGTNIANQLPSYGTKGVETPYNDPGSRSNSATWVLNNKLYLMGGLNAYGAKNDLWVFDLSTNNWTWLSGSTMNDQLGNYGTKGVPASTNVPSARINAVTWTHNNKLYLMGGFINAYYSGYNDLWEYDPSTNMWTWLKGSNTFNDEGNYGTQGVADPNNVPRAREMSSGWVYNNKFYLFGGWTHDYQFRSLNAVLNDVWEYNPATNNWRWLKGSKAGFGATGVYGTKGIAAPANTPEGRKNSFTWANNEKAYIFGGNKLYGSGGGGSTLSDLWEYDVTTNNWRWLSGSDADNAQADGVLGVKGVPAATNFVGAREQGSSFFSNNKLFIMGGFGKIASSYNTRDDIWEYDLSTNLWTWLKGSSTGGTSGVYGTQGISDPNNNPAASIYHVGWYANSRYYMMGGGISALWLYVPTCTQVISISSGDWNDVNTWSCGRIPTLTDEVTINGHTVAVNGNCFAKKVIKKAGAIVNVASGGNLKVGN